MRVCLGKSFEEGLSIFGVGDGLEDGSWSVVECEDGRADVVGCVAELTCHCVGYSEGGSWYPPSEYCFVEFRDTDEGVGRPACAGEDGPAIVVPVDYEMGIAEEADDEGDEEGRY